MDKAETRRIARHTFADQQSNEESWYSSAISFHQGANILGQHEDSIRRGKLVVLTNSALSIELLLKAIIVANCGKAPKTHELLRLARDAGVTFSNDQEATLEWLSEILKWSGRYPVPNKEADWDHYFDNVQEKTYHPSKTGKCWNNEGQPRDISFDKELREALGLSESEMGGHSDQ